MPQIVLPDMVWRSGKPLLSSTNRTSVFDTYTGRIHMPRHVSLASGKQGLMSSINGELDTSNLGESSFRFSERHIMPEQASLARMGSVRDTGALYGGTLGSYQHDDSDQWVTLAGTSVRWYQPYDATVAILQWSVFFSHNNWMGRYAVGARPGTGVVERRTEAWGIRGVPSHSVKWGNSFNYPDRTDIKLRCLLDGEYVSNSVRYISHNMFHPVSPGSEANTDHSGPGLEMYEDYSTTDDNAKYPLKGGNPKYVWSEAHSAVPFDIHHVTALSKGFHEITLQARFKGTYATQPVFVQNIGNRSRTKKVLGRGYFNLVPKLCLGIRNSRIVSFI
jgi:hypothetical protein